MADRGHRAGRLAHRAPAPLTAGFNVSQLRAVVQGDGSAIDRAWLADWRRQVAALYAEVRALAATDPAVAHRHWRSVRERLFREHPQSPVPRDARDGFRAALGRTPDDAALSNALRQLEATLTESRSEP